jgi:exopolysaccharide biosynthesis polyprenyl glycosylphosphotransferase
MNRVYDPEKFLSLSEEMGAVLLNSIYAGIALSGLVYLSERGLSRILFITFLLISITLLVIHRFLYRIFIKDRTQGKGVLNRILIAGAGPVGIEFARKISLMKDIDYQIIGYLDDNINLNISGARIYGTLDNVKEVVNKYRINNIIIALPSRAHERITDFVSQVHTLPVRLWIIPDYFHLTLSQAKVTEFAGMPLIDLRSPALTYYQRLIKRVFDLLLCVLMLIVLTPVFLLIMLIIAIGSPGPVFYISERVKENGELFKMIKFRTMHINADQLLDQVAIKDKKGNTIYKRPDDPRLTRVGGFLRKTSLDELPQLINVLIGDMSLVGPRPELPQFVDRYELWQRKRFTIPQGMTGWWQVNGRSDKPMHLNTEDDIYYIQNYSIWLDLKILAKTILVVLRAKGAY